MPDRHVSRIVKRLLPIPKRPYKNFADYMAATYYSWKEKCLFPCVECGGSGWYYDPDDCDPIEGYKMASRHRCKKCGGSRTGPRKVVFANYNQYVDKWRKERNLVVQQREAMTKVLSKLTHADIDVLFSVISQQCGNFSPSVQIWNLKDLGKRP